MRILTLLILLTLTVASCAKKEPEKFQAAQTEATSFGGEAPATTTTKPAPKPKIEAPGQPAPSEGAVGDKLDAPGVVGGGSESGGSAPTCGAACKRACQKFSGAQAACEKAYLAGCFTKPRTAPESECKVPAAKAKKRVTVEADEDSRTGKVEKSAGDGAALPKLFGDP